MQKENVSNSDLVKSHEETIQKYFADFIVAGKNTLPGSLILLGDHTHYNEGLSIAALVDRSVVTSIALSSNKSSKIILDSENLEIDINLDNHNDNLRADVIRTAFTFLKNEGFIKNEINCVINYNIPDCFGLGLYSALVYSFTTAVFTVFDIQLEQTEKLKLVKKIEIASIGKISNRTHHYNYYNQFKNSLLKMDLRLNEATPLKFKADEFRIVIVDTGKAIPDIRDTCNSRIEECEVGVKGLKLYIWGIKSLRDVNKTFLERHVNMIPKRVYDRVFYNVTERERVEAALALIEQDQYDILSEIVQQSHDGLKNEYELNYPELNFLQSAAMNIEGVTASKLISCSPIKSTYNIVHVDHVESFQSSIVKRYLEKYGKTPKTFVLKIFS